VPRVGIVQKGPIDGLLHGDVDEVNDAAGTAGCNLFRVVQEHANVMCGVLQALFSVLALCKVDVPRWDSRALFSSAEDGGIFLVTSWEILWVKMLVLSGDRTLPVMRFSSWL
jgi:hypothetical protein